MMSRGKFSVEFLLSRWQPLVKDGQTLLGRSICRFEVLTASVARLPDSLSDEMVVRSGRRASRAWGGGKQHAQECVFGFSLPFPRSPLASTLLVSDRGHKDGGHCAVLFLTCLDDVSEYKAIYAAWIKGGSEKIIQRSDIPIPTVYGRFVEGSSMFIPCDTSYSDGGFRFSSPMRENFRRQWDLGDRLWDSSFDVKFAVRECVVLSKFVADDDGDDRKRRAVNEFVYVLDKTKPLGDVVLDPHSGVLESVPSASRFRDWALSVIHSSSHYFSEGGGFDAFVGVSDSPGFEPEIMRKMVESAVPHRRKFSAEGSNCCFLNETEGGFEE